IGAESITDWFRIFSRRFSVQFELELARYFLEFLEMRLQPGVEEVHAPITVAGGFEQRVLAEDIDVVGDQAIVHAEPRGELVDVRWLILESLDNLGPVLPSARRAQEIPEEPAKLRVFRHHARRGDRGYLRVETRRRNES